MVLRANLPKSHQTTVGSVDPRRFPPGTSRVKGSDQVGTDITYIALRKGFLYLVLVDRFSRHVLSWKLQRAP